LSPGPAHRTEAPIHQATAASQDEPTAPLGQLS